MLTVGVIGIGTWGKNHVRVWSELPQAKLVAIADNNPEVAQRLAVQYHIAGETDYRMLLRNPNIHAVSICTPSGTHYAVAKAALEAGKHVLLEKPIALTAKEAQELVILAAQKNCIFMPGHIFRFDPVILRIKQELENGTIGKVNFLYSSRLGLMTPRPDCGVIMDFALHDIDIACFLLEEWPDRVTAVGQTTHSGTARAFEDVGFITMHFPSGVLANASVSWLTQKKVRDLWVIGSGKSIGADLISQQCDIFDKGVMPDYSSFGEFKLITKQGGDDVRVTIENREPLKEELSHFANCVLSGKAPKVTGEIGARVVTVIAACYRSMQQGKTVEVSYG